jgi:hypothetical protein
VPRPVNPGPRQYEAVAEGFRGTASLEIQEGERQRITIELTPDDSAAQAPSGEGETTTSTVAAPGADSGEQKPTNFLRIGSYVGLGIGVVGLVAGTVFSLQAKSTSDEADALFDEHRCGEEGAVDCPRERIDSMTDDAKGKQTLGIVGFIVGGVGIAAGATLFVLSMGGDKEPAADAAHLRVVAGPGSLSLHGRF